MNISEYNKNVWDKYIANKVRWTIPVSKVEIENARNGIWNIVLTPTKSVPHNWFPDKKRLKKPQRHLAWDSAENRTAA